MATIADVLSDPVKQFTDQNGKPYAMGFLYSFLSGTITPHPTYADSALTIPNQNPVPLDAAGRATIYTDQVMYRFRLANNLDQKVWERDDVPGSIWPGAVDAMSVRNPPPNTNAYGHQFSALVNKASTGIHPIVATVIFAAPTIGAGNATLTEATTVLISGEPSGANMNYALYIHNGSARFDGQFRLGTGQVALGSGAVATLGTTGGNGPANPAQAGWQAVVASNGGTIYFPYWV